MTKVFGFPPGPIGGGHAARDDGFSPSQKAKPPLAAASRGLQMNRANAEGYWAGNESQVSRQTPTQIEDPARGIGNRFRCRSPPRVFGIKKGRSLATPCRLKKLFGMKSSPGNSHPRVFHRPRGFRKTTVFQYRNTNWREKASCRGWLRLFLRAGSLKAG